MSCGDVRELLEGYSLGGLAEDERARVESHLASCVDCRAIVARYEEVLAGLPDALALVSPLRLPEASKQRLLAAIESVPTEPDEGPPRALLRRHPSRPMRRVLALAGAVALVLALASTAALSFQLDHERQLKERFAGLLDQREILLDVVDGRDTERTFLRSPDESSTAYGKLFTNPRLRDVVVMAGRLRQPEDGEQYRVLLTSGGVTRSPGTLKVNANGFGLLVFEARRPGPRYDAVRITLDPAGVRPGRGRTVLRSTHED